MNENRLHILWTSGDREVALKMVFMYGLNSRIRGWWDEVHIIVWGASTKLLAEDSELQMHVSSMVTSGVKFSACKKCSDEYGVSDALLQLGIDVRYMGEPLTEILRSGEKFLAL